MRLTKRIVDELSLPDGKSNHFVFDDQITGFGVRIYGGGQKSFFVRYTARGRRRVVVLGAYGVLTVEQAREQAKILLGASAQGKDPAAERQERRKAVPTFDDLAAFYIQHHLPYNKPRTQKTNRMHLDRYFLPKFRRRELAGITKQEIQSFFLNLHGKTSQKTGRPVSGGYVNRMAITLRKIFALAVEQGWLSKNPVASIQRFNEEQRERIATSQEEARLMAAIEQLNNPYMKAYFKLMWETGARRNEIQKMQWQDLDLENGFYHIKDTKANRPFTMPLSNTAIAILRDLRDNYRVAGNDHVIVGDLPGKPVNYHSIGNAWRALRSKAGCPDLRLHDVRRTTGSNMLMAGEDIHTVAQILGHSEIRTTQRYAQLAQAYKRRKIEEHSKRRAEMLEKIIPVAIPVKATGS